MQSCSGDIAELQAVFDVLDDTTYWPDYTILPPYRTRWLFLQALRRGYVASFVLNLPHTNALIRRLQDDLILRFICRFGKSLPHRTTFNRFIQRMAHHADLVKVCFARLTDRLKELLPDLGQEVAIDATVVRTHSNPDRKQVDEISRAW